VTAKCGLLDIYTFISGQLLLSRRFPFAIVAQRSFCRRQRRRARPHQQPGKAEHRSRNEERDAEREQRHKSDGARTCPSARPVRQYGGAPQSTAAASTGATEGLGRTTPSGMKKGMVTVLDVRPEDTLGRLPWPSTSPLGQLKRHLAKFAHGFRSHTAIYQNPLLALW
jgi:hypothetical protein